MKIFIKVIIIILNLFLILNIIILINLRLILVMLYYILTNRHEIQHFTIQSDFIIFLYWSNNSFNIIVLL